MPASHIAILNQFHGPSNSITLREASIGACIGESVEIIRSGRADLMLVGTTGSRLLPFKMIHAIQQEELTQTDCRPFDAQRDGTVLGEGAGAVLLEERQHAEKRGATIYGEVLAGSYRYSRNVGTAIKNVLQDVLDKGHTAPEQIGHINAHGLGSREADKIEAQTIASVFGSKTPVVSLKGHFGNLGAGGGTVEFIAGILALHYSKLFPTLGFATPDKNCPICVAATPNAPAGDSFVKLAFNHQGQASAVLVKKV
jgi:3-oxoacyl-[acyl-carrier-protein] synthase II